MCCCFPWDSIVSHAVWMIYLFTQYTEHLTERLQCLLKCIVCYHSSMRLILYPLSLYSTATQNYWRCGQREPPPTRKFALAIPICWYLKTLKLALPPMRNIKFALHPTQNPNRSQWNIGCVGSQTQNFRVRHVHFMLFVSISFTLAIQRERSFQWNMGFSITHEVDMIGGIMLPSYRF